MIDARELHIGAHILVNGERKRVDHFGCNGEIGEIYIDNPQWTKEKRLKEYSKHTWFCTQIGPIPLTAELLTEIGFEHGSDEREWHKYIGEAWRSCPKKAKKWWWCTLTASHNQSSMQWLGLTAKDNGIATMMMSMSMALWRGYHSRSTGREEVRNECVLLRSLNIAFS